MEKRKQGRPRKEYPKDMRFSVCFDKMEYDHIIEICAKTGLSMADVVRESVRLYGDSVKSND